ncbi:MAG: OsmC family protein [Bacteroidota bacterium]|nr:OsmC family protein [Bacteroidota bacterium]
MPIRKANAQWNGDLLKGNGTISTETGVLNNTQFNFSSRFEEGKGTNPEELIGAAHAGCYSMALSAGLSGGGFKVNWVKTSDTVHIDKVDGGFAITAIDINCEANVEGISKEDFLKAAEDTKAGCPVSKALTGVKFNLNAKLVE